MKKKVAIIACAMAFPGEKGYTRFSYLANMLCESGYEVDVYTSTFNHWEKAQRDDISINKIRKNVNYGIFLGYEPGYKKNVDIKRVFSHLKLTKNILYLIDGECKKEKYDLLYCVIPDNNLAACVAAYGKKNGIPVIIDIEDLWPEGMKLAFGIPVISDIIFSPFSIAAKKAYSNAQAFIGTSDEFRDEPLKYGVDKPRKTVYVGCDLGAFDRGVKKFSLEIEKSSGEFWVIYAGTLGSSYDIGTLVKTAQALKEKGYSNIKFKVLGTGPLSDEFKRIASENPCEVEFLGYQPYEKMAAYLVNSDVTVNSFVRSAPQSIVNKVGDYLAAGKPMINTLGSKEFRAKVDADRFGINVEAEDVEILSDAIMELYLDSDRRKIMGQRAREIAEIQFDRKNSYTVISDLIDEIINLNLTEPQ